MAVKLILALSLISLTTKQQAHWWYYIKCQSNSWYLCASLRQCLLIYWVVRSVLHIKAEWWHSSEKLSEVPGFWVQWFFSHYWLRMCSLRLWKKMCSIIMWKRLYDLTPVYILISAMSCCLDSWRETVKHVSWYSHNWTWRSYFLL